MTELEPGTGGSATDEVVNTILMSGAPLGFPGTFQLTEATPDSGQPPRVFNGWLTKYPGVTAGYGGWSRVARPRKKALTEWVGRDSVSIDIAFMLDNFSNGAGRYVEKNITILEQFAGIDSLDREPPLVLLSSTPEPLMPHGQFRASHVRWFVDTLTWDADAVIVNRAGNRIRAGGSLTVTQFVEDERLAKLAPPKKDTIRSRVKHYRVKKGDTLQKIAARKDVYGDSKQWKKIAKANGIRDPKLGAKWIGKLLKIP